MKSLILCCFIVIYCGVAHAAPQYAFGCSSCHRMPPVDASTRDTGTGGFMGNHQTHQPANAQPANCSICHPNATAFTTSHMNGKIGFQPNLNSSPSASQYKVNGTVITFKNQTSMPDLGACSNVNCHFETVTPQWGSPAFSYISPIINDCDNCHGAPPAGAGSHTQHIARFGGGTTSCAVCHPNHAAESAKFAHATTASAGHRDLRVTFTGAPGGTGTYAGSTKKTYPNYLPSGTGSYGQCSKLYCHGSATATWGIPSTATCGSCHSVNYILQGKHSQHYESTAFGKSTSANNSTSTTYIFNCGVCHYKAPHGNGPANPPNQTANVAFSATVAGGGSYTPGAISYTDTQTTWKYTNGACSATYCHSQGRNSFGTYSAPKTIAFDWSTGSTLTCAGCHGDATTAGRLISTGKHSAHLNPASNPSLGLGNGMGCIDCHAKTVSNNSTIKDKSKHVNKFIDYSSIHGGGSARYNAGTHLCANIYCHSNGNPAALVYANPAAWNSTTTYGCNGCHGTSSTIGAPDYTNGGAGTATANSHGAHVFGATSTTVCSDCHAKTANMTTTGRFKDYTAVNYHLNGTPSVYFNKTKAGATISWNQAAGQCSNIACHGGSSANWGSTAGCLACHAFSVNNRAAIGPQFSANSHHIQGVTITGAHCYQCHWEANSDGTINHTYHHSGTPGAAVELVVYGSGVRPTTYSVGTTAIQYIANGSRTEMAKINTHCLGCHSSRNNSITPFADGKTPKAYAWDNSSVDARFSNVSTTPWGKYSGGNVSPKNVRTKAFSAHGNATANQGGFNTSETWPNTRAGTSNVLCFDCHNSHGSSVAGTTTSYVSATTNGGILKDTLAGKGGYTTTYKPAAGGSSANHNIYNSGAGLCFDCHLNASAGTTPWGFTSTFGATQQIMSYWDTPYFGAGTFGSLLRYPYKPPTNMGGHFGASSVLKSSALKPIGGLCTPCHDPHGLSPMLGASRRYAVPILKGTWVTSPYKEDTATKDNQAYKYLASPNQDDAPRTAPGTFAAYTSAIKSYHIDQNTFATGAITQTDAQFAGLCLSCHSKTNLTNGMTHTWKSKDRVHESVKGWKTANATVQHSYTCSKCHAPHNSFLPRLMVSNCLDSKHRGRVTNNTSAVTSFSYRGSEGSGAGAMPGSYSGGKGGGDRSSSASRWGGWGSGSNPPSSNIFTCHENNDANQLWNTVTPWTTR